MFICNECNDVFEEGVRERQNLGNYGDETIYEDWCVCPSCGGDFEEAVRCKICDTYNHERDLIEDVCEDCIRESLTVDNFLKYLTDENNYNEALEDFVKMNVIPKGKSLISLIDEYKTISEQEDFSDKCFKYLEDTNELEDYVDFLNEKGWE